MRLVGVGVLFVMLFSSAAWADNIDEGRRLLDTRKHKEGVVLIRKGIAAFEKKGDDADAVRRAGIGYFFLQEDAKATAAFTRAVELAPKDPAGYDWLGVLRQYSDRAKAVKALEKAVSPAPDEPFYLLELADQQRRLEKNAEAHATYKKVMAVDEKNPLAHMRAGNLLIHAGRKPEGVKHLVRAIALDPTLVLARYNVAQMHYDDAKIEGTVRHAGFRS